MKPTVNQIKIFSAIVAIGLIYFLYREFKYTPLKPTKDAVMGQDVSPKPIKIITPGSENVTIYSKEQPSADIIASYSATQKVLQSKGTDFCQLYKMIDDINIESNKVADRKYPADESKAMDYGDQWFKKHLHEMLSNKTIPDSVGDIVWYNAHYFCPEKYN